MDRYRIAFFTVDWNYDLVESTLHGLKQFVDDHEEVNLCIFDCFGKDINNARDHSEYAIFDLVDLDQFDGLLIQGNQIVLGPVRDAIAKRVAQSGIPAVSIDCPIEGCTVLGIDNRRAQHDIARHIINEHGARRLVYLTGILDNGSPEAHQRLEGFQDACNEAGLDPKDIEVIRCNWRTSDGLRVAERWHRDRLPLPDAFVCGNDEMALGLIEGLQKHGWRVPDDVLVTGFDNITSAELSRPRLSTISRDYSVMNYSAMDCLINKIKGIEKRDFIPFKYDVICSESCGCPEGGHLDYFRDKYFQQTRTLKAFFVQQEQLAEEMFDALDLTELMEIVERNQGIFGCDSTYLCINDYYYDNYDKKQWRNDSERFGREMILAACGNPDTSADENHIYARFPTRYLLPGRIMDDQRFLIFYPLHYNTYSIGYFVMNGISQAAKLNLHESVFSFLEIAIENVRKKGLLRQLNDVLDNLYVHDALTGLYNRFGYERFAQQTYEGFLRDDGGAQVLFVDMDDMKNINDRYGHEIGDAAIRTAAEHIKKACRAGDFMMRYGGDEFLVIASIRESGLADALARMPDVNSEELPCRLSLTVGQVLSDGSASQSLDHCIQAADARMYEIKKQKKGMP